VRISGVGDASPAAVAGLRPGDVLTRFGGQALTNLQDLSDALAQAKPGDAVGIEVVRDGKPVALRAILGERGGGE
jgi:S1-C subfamily serine protease